MLYILYGGNKMKLGKIQKLALLQLASASAVLGVPLKTEGIEKLTEYKPREPEKEPEVNIPTEHFIGGNYFMTTPTETREVVLYDAKGQEIKRDYLK